MHAPVVTPAPKQHVLPSPCKRHMVKLWLCMTQVGDMRQGWKKMKAAGLTSDDGLRFGFHSLPHDLLAVMTKTNNTASVLHVLSDSLWKACILCTPLLKVASPCVLLTYSVAANSMVKHLSRL